MKRRTIRYAPSRFCFLLAGLAPLLMAAAQDAPKPASDGKEVVITARPPAKRQEVINQARAISSSVDRRNSTLARFSGPICPAVYGLSSDLNSSIRARVRKDAMAVGMSVDKDKCTANALIIFVPNGQVEIEALVKTNPALFGGLSPEERQALADDPGPVHCWRGIEVRGSGGDVVDNQGGLSQPSLKVWWPSHLILTTQLAIAGAVVVIDLPAATGKSVAQLADYSAMRLFAETRPPRGDAATDTILTLFNTSAVPPATLTAFDVAFLKTVYRAGSGQLAVSTLASVAHTLQSIPAAPAKR